MAAIGTLMYGMIFFFYYYFLFIKRFISNKMIEDCVDNLLSKSFVEIKVD